MPEVTPQVLIKFYLSLGITELCELISRLDSLFNYYAKCSKAPNAFYRVLCPCTHVAWEVSYLSTYVVTYYPLTVLHLQNNPLK